MDPDNDINLIEFGNSIQDERFEDYLKAKILLANLRGYLYDPFDKAEVVDHFIKNYTSSTFKSGIDVLEQQYIQAIEDEFKNNAANHSAGFWAGAGESALMLGDILQTTGKGGLNIIIEATRLSELKNQLKKLNGIVSLLEEDYRDNGDDVAYLPFLVPYQALFVASQSLYQDSVDMMKSGNFSYEGISKLAVSMGTIVDHIDIALKTINHSSSAAEATAKLLKAKSNFDAIQAYLKVHRKYDTFLSIYDGQAIWLNILSQSIDMALNIADGLKEAAPEKASTKIGSVLNVMGGAKSILIDLAEEVIKFTALINGQAIDTYGQIRAYERYFDDWVYLAHFNARYYDEVFAKLGGELKDTYLGQYHDSDNNIFISYASGNTGQTTCFDVDTEGLNNKLLDIKPVAEEVPDAPKPSMMWLIPQNATLENYQITATQGEKVSFSPFLTAKSFIGCMSDVVDKEVLWKLWYYDVAKGNSAPRESLELTLDKATQTFSFDMPSSQIQVVSLTYNILNEPNNFYAYGSCGLPEVWESINVTSGDNNDTGGGGEDNGILTSLNLSNGHEIIDIVGIGRTSNIIYQNGYSYLSSSTGIHVIKHSADHKDLTHVATLKIKDTVSIEKIANNRLLAISQDSIVLIDFENMSLNIIDQMPIIIFGGYVRDIYKVDTDKYVLAGNEDYIIKIINNKLFVETVINNYGHIIGTYDNNNLIMVGWLPGESEETVSIMQINDDYTLTAVRTFKLEKAGEIGRKIIDKYLYQATKNKINIYDLDTGDIVKTIIPKSDIRYINMHSSAHTAYLVFQYQDNSLDKELVSIDLSSNTFNISPWEGNALSPQMDFDNNYMFSSNGYGGMVVYQILDNGIVEKVSSFEDSRNTDIQIINDSLFVLNESGLNIYKIHTTFLEKISEIQLEYAYRFAIKDNVIYIGRHGGDVKFDYYNISDLYNPVKIDSLDGQNNYMRNMQIIGNTLYTTKDTGFSVYNIESAANPEYIRGYGMYGISFYIHNGYAYSVRWVDNKIRIMNLADEEIKEFTLSITPYDIVVDENKIYIAGSAGLSVYELNSNQLTELFQEQGSYSRLLFQTQEYIIVDNRVYDKITFELIKNVDISDSISSIYAENNYVAFGAYSYSYLLDVSKEAKNILLLSESPSDYDVRSTPFSKSWTFSEDISTFDIEFVANNYGYDYFIKNNNTLSVKLYPDTDILLNKMELKFTKNGSPVTVSRSDTFWSVTKTNHAPRLADGQITQLVSATNEPAFLEIVTYDADGDTVALNIEDDDGGYVGFDPDNPNRIFASFSDGEVAHTIKISLNDGKETVVKEFNVLQFDQTSIDTFYSDVDKSAGDYIYDGIAFGTLKGVVWGQPDPNDPAKRIFRPTDPASLAEALAIIINAENKAGLITLETADDYRSAFPEWARPYYTFAMNAEALDREIFDLSTIYPTRETIAKLIVKTLKMDDKAKQLDINVTFTDESDFSDIDMLSYGKIAHSFGLFMTGSTAKPQETISRAELAMVIRSIFMIPTATLGVTPESVEYGDSFTASLSDIHAEGIDGTNYTLHDTSAQLQTTYIANGVPTVNPIGRTTIPYMLKNLDAILNNSGIKNMISTPLNITFSDQDSDGVQDAVDQWINDPRYAYDENSNGIPDILDILYSLSAYNASSIVTINGEQVTVADIIRDGRFFPDLDDDGISDTNDPDMDGDGVVNEQDVFPRDKNEWEDTDGDGIGNNADTDDDNDGMSDEYEDEYGFDSLDPSDANEDWDGDGYSNLQEYLAGTDPSDREDKPKGRFAPSLIMYLLN